MEPPRNFVLTKREALNILGIRKAFLAHLERAAKVPHVSSREGYTQTEIKRLLEQLKMILGR